MAISEHRYALWVSDKDENGTPIDPQFIQAAYALEPSLFNYRRREVGCDSVTATLVQAAVNTASRAAHLKPVQNPLAYLFTVFARKVDKHLATASVEVAVEDNFIEALGNRACRYCTAQIIEDRILLDELKSHMDEWTRMVCNMRMLGYSNDEIARDLGEPANRVAVRYSRGLSKAADRLLSCSSNEQKSRG